MIFFDNDVIHKLSCCDLLDDSYNLVNPIYKIYVLDTAKYVLKKKTKKQGVLVPTCYSRIESFLLKTNCYEHPNENIVSQLMPIEDIDPGEALFIEGLISHQDSCFLTGDKRCLIALAKSDFYRAHLPLLAEKSVCFEQIILFLIENIGFDQVKTKILPARECDKMLKSVFTDHAQKSSVIEGINSYFLDLRKQTDNLLCHQFPKMQKNI